MNTPKDAKLLNSLTRRQFNKNTLMGVTAFGITPLASLLSSNEINSEINMYDTVIIGGSYSGLSAGMTLGRSIRKTLIIDGGKPCNAQTPFAHNFITQDGVKPSTIASQAKAQVLKYPTVEFSEDLVTQITGANGNFTVKTKSNKTYNTKKLIFATGVKDKMPKIEGFSECWGITAVHCPYCHGYEVKSKNTGILVNDESAIEFAKVILNWTDKLTIYSNGNALFDKSELTHLNVPVIEKTLKSIQHEKGYMTQLTFEDDSTTSIDALYHRAVYEQHCKIPELMGCEMTDSGHIQVNDFQQTNLPGIYAVGDATTYFRTVSIASASGTKAGAMLNHELITERYQ